MSNTKGYSSLIGYYGKCIHFLKIINAYCVGGTFIYPCFIDFFQYHMFISSTAFENMLEDYLIIIQLGLMGISISLPQKTECGPHRQMGMLPKIETKLIREN